MKTIKRLLALLFCALLFLPMGFVKASADMGPKPSVYVTFENMSDELCYGTLLSKYESTGPASAWDGVDENARQKGNYEYADFEYEIWKTFVGFEDGDGYYFLQAGWEVSKHKTISWTYYPPSSFKILLYYPERNVFAVSGIYERYAFDTYYSVDMANVELPEADGARDVPLLIDERLEARNSYDYTREILSLIARILITVLIEIGIALLFGFREKKQLLFLAGINGFTQIVLNVLLNIVNYRSGAWAFIEAYVLLEFIVFAIEAAAYALFMNKVSDKPKKRVVCVLYALAANLVSFGVGMGLSQWFPMIF